MGKKNKTSIGFLNKLEHILGGNKTFKQSYAGLDRS
jgi:hypothetical protein